MKFFNLFVLLFPSFAATVDKVEARRYLYGHLPISQASEALIDTAVYYDLPTATRLALAQHQGL